MKKIIRAGLLIAIVGLAVLFYFLDPAVYTFYPRCLFNSLTGYYCPGCGSQRAIHSLLHLDFAGVINNNFLFLPATILIIYHYLHPIINRFLFWNLPNLFYYKSTPWIIFGTVILFWILRNLPSYPFIVLAPV